MKQVTAVLEITHGGQKTVVKGSDAQAMLNKLMNWNGQGEIYLQYTDPANNQLTGFKFCCDDTWKRLLNEVSEVAERDCKFDCADKLAFTAPKQIINRSTGKILQGGK